MEEQEKVNKQFPFSFFLLVLPFFSLFFLFLSCSSQTQPGYAPDFKLPRLNSNESLQLSKLYKETPVLLVFWATWCEPCVAEIPTLNQWHSKYSDKFQVIGINFQEEKETIEAFLKEHEIDYPILLDREGKVGESYEFSSLPAVVLLAKGGKIRYYGFTLPAKIEELV